MAQPGKNSSTDLAGPAADRRRRLRPPLAGVRFTHVRYMLLFAHVPLFLKMQPLLASQAIYILSVDIVTWMRIAFFFGAGVLFAAATRARIKAYAVVLNGAATLFFALWQIAPAGTADNTFAILYSLFLGGSATMALYYYTFALNHVERFAGAAATSLYYVFFQLVLATGLPPADVSRLYIGGLLLGTLLCTAFARPDDAAAGREPQRQGVVPLALAAYIFISYHVIEMFYVHLQGLAGHHLYLINGLAGIAIFVLALVVHHKSANRQWHLLNIFFLGLILVYLIRLTSGGEQAPVQTWFFNGFGQIGFIVAFSLLGGILNSFATLRRFKLVVLGLSLTIAAVYALLGFALPNLPVEIPRLAMLVSSIIFAVFIILTPLISKNVFYLETPDRAEPAEAAAPAGGLGNAGRIEALLDEKKLTTREKEIIRLLMRGLIYKECAHELGISLNTIKFHAGNAYVKLGISGRSQLFSVLNRDA